MGLDAVHLILKVEDRFGIALRDDELSDLIKVEDLTRLVLSRIAARTEHACPSLRAFLTLRADVRQVMHDQAFRIRPSQRISDVIPARKRRALWKQLQKRLAYVLQLKRPKALRYALLVLTVLLFVIGLTPVLIDMAILPLSLVGAGALAVFLNLATIPFCVVPPVAMATFGDVTRRFAGMTVALNDSIAPNPTTWVPEVVQDLIAEAVGVDRREVVPTARFVDDLGLG
jgi:acyl carrier protein